MYLLLKLGFYISMAWICTCDLPESELARLLPDMTALCPSVDVCGRMHLGNTSLTRQENLCCMGCSCSNNCHGGPENCCFHDDITKPENEHTTCLKPSINQNQDLTAYSFITDPPNAGCEGQGLESSCSQEVVVAPWGNFLPVYSKSLDKNFKNKPCAMCHGVHSEDVEEWKSRIVYTGTSSEEFASDMAHFYDTFNSSHVTVIFEPSTKMSGGKDKRCFELVDDCFKLSPLTVFYVPSVVQLEREAIVIACTHGPSAMYIQNRTHAFKNVFCAMCNSFSTAKRDALKCSFDGGLKSNTASFTSLFDSQFLQRLATTPQADKEVKTCFRPGNQRNESRCVEPFCPTLQRRLASGKCAYPTVEVGLGCVILSLNLSTKHTLDESFRSGLTETGTMTIFGEKNPWPASWEIKLIGLLMTENKTEFQVLLTLSTTRIFTLRQLTGDIERRLSKRWILQLDKEMEFTQNFISHFHSDQVVLYRAKFRSRFCPQVNKLYYCQQIELLPSEYTIESEVLRLLHNGKLLYAYEYMMLEAGDVSERVRVCLEDSGYVRIEHANAATHVVYRAQMLVVILGLVFM